MTSSCLILVVVFALLAGAHAQSCSSYVTCNTCINAPITCGWCAGNTQCYAGDANGPTAPNTCDASVWQFDNSQILSSTPGVPVNPATVSVFLAPNQALTVPIEVLVLQSDSNPLDVYFLEDSSASFADDIATFQALVPELVLNLLLEQPDTTFGIGTFIEKPTSADDTNYDWPTGSLPESAYETPTGGPGRLYGQRLFQTNTNAAVKCPSRPSNGQAPFDQGPVNWNFCNELNLTADYTAMQNAVDSLVYNGNRDYPENSLEALMFSMVCPIGWRANSKKIVVIATDAKFHYNGQPTNGNWYPFNFPMPNNLDCVKDTWANGWLPGVGEDYPTIEEVKNLLLAKGAIPIFLVTETSGDSGNHLGWYTDIVNNQFGFGYARQLSSNSADLVSLIIDVLDDTASTVTMTIASDPSGVVQSFSPGTVNNVVPGSRVTFNVVLLVNTYLQTDATVTMTAVGFGNTVITVTTSFPCLGCNGIPNSDFVYDRCGVCGGSNACVGCDDVPYSGMVWDVCNVCGGDGRSCLGCDDVPFSGCEYDVCGVCCGDNSTCTSTTSGQALVSVPAPALSAGGKAGIAVGTISMIALIAGAAVLAYLSRSAYIKVEQEYKDLTDGVKDNPLYKATGQWKVNQLA